jgi:chemotaxis response regulator CheB
MNILVVEDSEDMRFLLSRLLPQQVPASEIRLAEGAREALSVAKAFRPDVVVLDSRIGDVSPQNTANALREVLPGTTFISFSGLQGEERPWADIIVTKAGDGIESLSRALQKLADTRQG